MLGARCSFECQRVAVWAAAVVLLFSAAAGAHEKPETPASLDLGSATEALEEPSSGSPVRDGIPHDDPAPHDAAEGSAEHLRDHEHAPGERPGLLAWLGKFHPALTHFPIALLSSAALAELLFMRRRSLLFEHAVRFSVNLGALSALLAAALGWLFAGFQLTDDEWVMTAHRWAGTATALWAVALLVVCARTETGSTRRRGLRIVLFGGALSVAATGFLGGALIYGLDHYAW